MSTSAALQPEPQPIIACTISRDVQIFDLLIEDMESALGENWGDLSFNDALAFLEQPEASELQFVAIALDSEDEDDLSLIVDIIAAAKAKSVKVILIAEDLTPASLHQLLREGGDEFVPYPLPEGELREAIQRVQNTPTHDPVAPEMRNTLSATEDRSGVVIPVHGMAGGTGATTLAVNLAWELANVDPELAPRVCLLDLDLQFGTVATYLDLPRREAVLELLTDTEAMDSEAFMQALLSYEQKLHVLTSPTDMIPLDLLGPADIERLIEMARINFDYVVIDLPATMVEWSETVLSAAHVYFATLELDMRSAQNTLRLKRALQSEELPFEKLRFALNRAPGFTDLNGKSRVKRLAESLGISIELLLPDGGKPVSQNADHGVPMAEGIPKNALRKEIAKLAKSVHDVNVAETAKAGG
ncbi:AAA family ATPase [Ponticoccus sp. SC2-23]|uniref:AAA family ATPase n=1 Tax=Alexandriicola marinus TaxID=2081710 RepID=UPI000FDA1EB6|nr:AAA family ATPase [Alexandriicola marinus]MBM1221553.1 AAA family ATPase [Ponticoccus sp. SC6-9]MBM1226594.1 AAA family ATPase [Ponticoccus sp. SC6-15]MBM1230545.1 AAA family ATPase [Ponticoccus sp. SC6-38]MBM1235068.1 AAA family ATPase [Ponticoccus sp. SC6-45]MBM1239566.1 AAA family ATPase [Ponticoccus sp. SC6-49]MBM1243348.1 AAA family ATPase [Ponticoccus sp. SC2-64]MBM1248592.1 AAA family ATPase [Ponticoccus sp. SC6-42]MBM1253177.1 AAA family ATPase [Ponticoccus sp. SC6-33]MBM1257575